MSRIRPAHAGSIFLAYCVLAVVWTWPLAANLPSRILHDPGDPLLNTWILWWNAQVPPLTEQWWNAPILFPMRGALALSEHLLGISVFATPLQLAGVPVLVVYNLAVLLSFAASGFFAYALVFRLSGSALGAWCAGLAFGFAPYRAGQLAHLQVLTSQWMPAMLLGLHEYLSLRGARLAVRHSPSTLPESSSAVRGPEMSTHFSQSAIRGAEQTRRGPAHEVHASTHLKGGWSLALFGSAWLLQALSNFYFMLFVPVLLVLWLAWFVSWRRDPWSGITIVAAWAAASLPLAPLLLKYREVHHALGLARSLGDIRQFSARLSSFLHPPPLLAFWPNVQGATQEDFLFPGLTIAATAAMALAGVIGRRELRAALRDRSPILFYGAVTLILCTLALGPGGETSGPASPWRPYTWLLVLPGFDGLRVPARLGMLVALTLSVTAGLGMARVATITVARATLGALVLVGLTIDTFMRGLPVADPAPLVALPGPADAIVLEIPPDDPRVSVGAMARQMSHRRPLVNGYTGHVAPHYAILSLSLWRGDTSVLNYLARQRPLVIIVDETATAGPGFRKMIDEMPGIERHGMSPAGAMFVLPRETIRPADTSGTRIRATVSDGGGRRLEVDLGAQHTVSAVTFDVQARFRQLAERILIEASEDGHAWRQVWLGWTGEFAFDAALRDPKRVPVRLPLPHVTTRFLRIYPTAPWVKEELMVLGHE